MRRFASGFTLVELVTVIIILGIMAAVAIPRMDTSGYRSTEFHDKTVAALRFAQKTATSHRRLVCVVFTLSTVSLTIAQVNPAVSCAAVLTVPGGNSNVVQSSDATKAFFTAVPATLYFQPDGRGTTDGAGTTIYSVSPTIGTSPITVVGMTGYVQ